MVSGHEALDAQLLCYAQDLHDLMHEHHLLNVRHQRMLESMGRAAPGADVFLTVLAHPDIASIVTDARGRVVHASPPAAALLETEAGVLVGSVLTRWLSQSENLWRSPVPATDVREALTHHALHLATSRAATGVLDAWVKVIKQGGSAELHWLLAARQPGAFSMGSALAHALAPVGTAYAWQIAEAEGVPTLLGDSVMPDFAHGELFGRASRQFGFSAGEETLRQAFSACMNAFGCWSGSMLGRRKDDGMSLQRKTVHAVCDVHGCVHAYLSVSFASNEPSAEVDRLTWLVHHDALTGLPNQRMLDEELRNELGQAQTLGHPLALVYLDLDRFKPINDSLGHHIGDQVLRKVAERLLACVRENDLVARVGGDEFVILLKGIQHKSDIQRVAETLVAAVAEYVQIGSHRIAVGCSMGCARHPFDGLDGATLTQNADAAMYAAKKMGGGLLMFHDAQEAQDPPISLGLALWGALERDEMQVVYQPQVDASNGRTLRGCEALLRWYPAAGGEIPPDVFIPIAERNGFICVLGEWVFKTAVDQLAQWHLSGLRGLRMSVNVSPRQLEAPSFVDSVLQLVQNAGVSPSCVELEVTESVAMRNDKTSFGALASLRAHGFKVAMDDFGMGYSSLARLKDMPIDRLKIDRQFVQDLASSSVAQAVSQCFVNVGLALGIDVIAEGVESAEQLDLLAVQGCNQVQGFLTGRPMRAAELVAQFCPSLGKTKHPGFHGPH